MPWSLPWAYPEYARQEFNSAARLLLPLYEVGDDPHYQIDRQMSAEELSRVFSRIDNWRSSHSYPLNIFQAGLRTRAKQVDEKAVVAQRLKRFPSILAKLKRFPEMKLTQIQDIAGCRAIVSTVPQVYALVKAYKESDIKHKLVHEDDYVQQPKESGYRSTTWCIGTIATRSQRHGMDSRWKFKSAQSCSMPGPLQLKPLVFSSGMH